MKDQIDQARWIAVLAATAIALYLCWLMLRPFLAVLAWAVVLVIVFYPVHKWLAQRIKRRGLCAMLSSTLVILIIVLPLVFLTIAVTNELAGAVRNFPSYMDQLMNPTSVTGRVLNWIQQRLGIDATGTRQFLGEQLGAYSSAILGRSVGIMGDVLSAIVKTFFV